MMQNAAHQENVGVETVPFFLTLSPSWRILEPILPNSMTIFRSKNRRPESAAEIPLVMNIEQDAEPLREFIHESHEHLANVEQGALVLEENPDDVETLNFIFRAFHTFKGTSGFFNLLPIHRLAHEMESLLDLARQQKLVITSAVVDLILRGVDVLKQFIAEMELQLNGVKPVAPHVLPTNALLARIHAMLKSVKGGRGRGGKSRGERQEPRAARLAPPIFRLRGTPKRRFGATAAHLSPGASSVIKVETHKFDALLALVEKLTRVQSRITEGHDLKAVKNKALARNLAQINRITRELQKTAMSAGRIPIRFAFQKMIRVVRDLSAKLGKQVNLTMSGEEVELDHLMVDKLGGPLMHMVCNAIVHGIEKPEIRLAAGKPAEGTVQLRAFRQGGNVVIHIKDDGAGLDRNRILAKAVEKSLASQKNPLNEREILELIFAPGFSTVEKVTGISGRGVGLDVAKHNIENLEGKITIESVPGGGTTFTILLPEKSATT